MRVLVTGATGYLGGALLKRLQARGYAPIALGRDSARCKRLRDMGFQTVQIDLSSPVGAEDAAKIGSLDAVVHCAALSAPWGRLAAFRAANVDGTGHALDLAERLGARRFVQISSPTVYFEFRDRLGVKESDTLPAPVNAYARTKAEAETMVQGRKALKPVILRPRGVYGASEQTLLPRLLAAARRGPLPLMRKGVAEIDLTHVSDVTSAIDAALAAGPAVDGQIINISSGEVVPVRYLVEQAAAASGVNVSWRRTPFYPALGAAKLAELASLVSAREPLVTPYTLGLFAFRQSLDISKAKAVLNWRPQIDIKTGFAMTFSGEGGA